jgi:hypothetical protein
MPTNLPARVTAYPTRPEDYKSGQALLLFYIGMATLALLLVAGERHFGMFNELSIAESVLQATLFIPPIDGIDPIWMQAAP